MEKVLFSSFTEADFKEIIKKALQDSLTIIQTNISTVKHETEFITRKQTAELLGVSLPTLGKWTKEGIIPAYRISSRVRYKLSEVQESLSKIKAAKP